MKLMETEDEEALKRRSLNSSIRGSDETSQNPGDPTFKPS
jgi:hypothetical protein